MPSAAVLQWLLDVTVQTASLSCDAMWWDLEEPIMLDLMLDLQSSLWWEFDIIAQPCQTFENTFTSGCAARLNFPDVIFSNLVELEHIRYLLWCHTYKVH